MTVKGTQLRAKEVSKDAKHAINLVGDNMERQVKRHRDKRRGRRSAALGCGGAWHDGGVSRVASWPPAWLGTWVAVDGKTVSIADVGGTVAVTVCPGPGRGPYRSAELLGGGTKPIESLPATCTVDERGRLYLEVEAGTPDVGPTYRLYAAREDDGGWRTADPDLPVELLVLVPNTNIGLYDDWDDDLGVPWAYPLDPLRWPPDGRGTP